MRRRRSFSLKHRLVLVMLLTSTVAVSLACAAFLAYDLVAFRRRLAEDLGALAGIVGQGSKAALSFNDPRAAEETLAALAATPQIVAAALYAADGSLFARYPAAREPPPALRPPPGLGHSFADDHVVLYHPVVFEGERIGAVGVLSDLAAFRTHVAGFSRIVWAVLGTSVVAAAVLSYRLQRGISDPILRLAATAHAVSQRKDYSLRAPPVGGRELKLLASTFNEMLQQIQEREEALRTSLERLREVQRGLVKRQGAVERANQELERSNRELEDFASVASHDLQEPLGKIRAHADRLRRQLGPHLVADTLRQLDLMQAAAARMQALIDDLLTLARVTTRAQAFAVVDLGAVAREVVADLELRIEQAGGSVEVGDLPTLEAEPTQMRQLLQNLVGNALKFRRPDLSPRVRVYAELNGEAGQGTPGGGERRERCRILVEDNGIGFDERHLDRIFTIFQRLHGRDEFEGTGVGLAVCRKIAERHGGSITARSRPGEGSTFIVTLPLRQEREEAR